MVLAVAAAVASIVVLAWMSPLVSFVLAVMASICWCIWLERHSTNTTAGGAQGGGSRPAGRVEVSAVGLPQPRCQNTPTPVTVAAEGGRVLVENHAEGGAVFTIAVPAESRTAAALEGESL
jgi:hypothetical protein